MFVLHKHQKHKNNFLILYFEGHDNERYMVLGYYYLSFKFAKKQQVYISTMHIYTNKKHIFCCYQNILTLIMYLKALYKDKKKLICFFLFFEPCFLPSIKKINLDNI